MQKSQIELLKTIIEREYRANADIRHLSSGIFSLFSDIEFWIGSNREKARRIYQIIRKNIEQEDEKFFKNVLVEMDLGEMLEYFRRLQSML